MIAHCILKAFVLKYIFHLKKNPSSREFINKNAPSNFTIHLLFIRNPIMDCSPLFTILPSFQIIINSSDFQNSEIFITVPRITLTYSTHRPPFPMTFVNDSSWKLFASRNKRKKIQNTLKYLKHMQYALRSCASSAGLASGRGCEAFSALPAPMNSKARAARCIMEAPRAPRPSRASSFPLLYTRGSFFFLLFRNVGKVVWASQIKVFCSSFFFYFLYTFFSRYGLVCMFLIELDVA